MSPCTKNMRPYDWKISKTDQGRSGHRIHIWATGTDTCPIKALRAYLSQQPLKSTQSPLFQFASGEPLSRRTVSHHLRHLAALAGLNPAHFNTHSLRTGAATAAASAGLDSWEIKSLGRWRSSAYEGYLRTEATRKAANHFAKAIV